MELRSQSPPSMPSMRAFLPFWITVALSAIVFVREYHIRHAPLTRLGMSVVIDGKDPEGNILIQVDGSAHRLDAPIAIGYHSIEVGSPYAEPIPFRKFVWYGRAELGRIDLRRSKLDVIVEASPRPDRVEISNDQGRRVSNLGVFTNLPAGRYVATLSYGALTVSEPVDVVRGKGSVSLKAKIAGVELSSDRPDAEFELVPVRDGEWATGKHPSEFRWMRSGPYRLLARRGDYRRESLITLEPGITNRIVALFPYGALDVQSMPTGASVFLGGKEVGITPIVVSEVIPGSQKLEIAKAGFDRVFQGIEVTAQRTNLVIAQLTNTTVRELKSRAEESVARGNYNLARGYLEDVLRTDPNDSASTELLRSIKPKALREEAGVLASDGKLATAIGKIDEALALLPGDRALTDLRADLFTKLSEKVAEEKAEEARRARAVAAQKRQQQLTERRRDFEALIARVRSQEQHAAVVPQARWTTRKPANEVVVQCQVNGAKDLPVSEIVSPSYDLTSFKLGKLLPLVKWGTYVRVVACTLEEGKTEIWASVFSYVPGPDGPTPITKPESTADLLNRTKQYLAGRLDGDVH